MYDIYVFEDLRRFVDSLLSDEPILSRLLKFFGLTSVSSFDLGPEYYANGSLCNIF